MSITTIMNTARRVLRLAAGAAVLLTLGASTAWAASGGGGALTCSISPSNGVTSVGQPVTFTASTTNAKGQITYAWTFSGPATPTSSTSQSQAVTYSATGTFAVSVHVVTTKSGECTANTNVTVSGGATNHAPTANPDSYNATQGQTLSVGAPGVLGNDTDPDAGQTLTAVLVTTTTKGTLSLSANGSFTYTYTGTGSLPTQDTFTYKAQDNGIPVMQSSAATVTITISAASTNGTPVGRGDTYMTPVGTTLTVTATRLSGVLYNDFDTDPLDGHNIGNANLTAQLVSGPTNGTLNLSSDGSFNYTPNSTLSDNQNDSFTYRAYDGVNLSSVTKVNINIVSKQTDFKIMMNYELGMHCTGFEFAYCCVLPPYNSILAQVVKPQPAGTPVHGDDFPRLLAGDPNNTDALGRPVVMRDAELDGSGNFTKYMLEYYHDAQPRHEGQGKVQTSTLISAVENNSLFYTSTKYDSAAVDGDGKLVTDQYEGVYGVVRGNGDFNDPTDNYANGWLNHFYIYADLEGSNPANTSAESAKIRLGVTGHIEYPANVGAALQPMGPTGSASGKLMNGNIGPFDNVLTFSGDTGTVVYTQMKVLENLPIMLTSPRIWEALGLPLTPFEDSINFFADPGAVDEDSIRPYVAMKARLHEALCDDEGRNCIQGSAVIGSNGQPVIGHGTAPIDIPNCERCHSVTDPGAANSPSKIRSDFGNDSNKPYYGTTLKAITEEEKSFWDAYYGISTVAGDSDWYSRLKGAAINMLALHDFDNGTGFTSFWPATECVNPNNCVGGPLTDETDVPQNTRLGKESVICQKCHADNVIAVVKSACTVDPTGTVLCPDGAPDTRKIIKPITEAIHWRHREISEGGTIDFADAAGRSGGCQGCHPAHRSDGVMDGYPITYGGDNFQANSDNRLASGGCFVGRDVHSNPMKDVDGAETPAHLNAVGTWLSSNVFNNQGGVAGISGSPTRGLWCTNCHSQLGQEMWKAENCPDLINGACSPNGPTNATGNIRGATSLADLVTRINAVQGTSYVTQDAINWLDPKNPLVQPTNVPQVTADLTHAIWDPDVTVNQDAAVALIEATGDAAGCNPTVAPNEFYLPRFGAYACLSFDGDPGGVVPTAGDPNVRILDFCTTSDCEAAANHFLSFEGTCSNGTNDGKVCTTDGSSGADCSVGGGTCIGNSTGLSFAFAAPFDAATDGRDHWLAPGEPHCADCHAAPYVEPSGGNIGDTDLLGRSTFKPPFNYPRKASLMRYSTGHQGVSCQGCHESIHGLYPVTPTIDTTSYAQAAALNADGSHGPLKCGTCHTVDSGGIPTWIRSTKTFGRTFDDVVGWAHTYTDNASPLDSTCQNCHGDRRTSISETSGKWLRHSFVGRVGRLTQDKAEIAAMGHVSGDPDFHAGATDQDTAANIAATVCTSCHSVNGGPSGNFLSLVACSNQTWKQHLVQGRLSPKVWEFITDAEVNPTVPGDTCGW